MLYHDQIVAIVISIASVHCKVPELLKNLTNTSKLSNNYLCISKEPHRNVLPFTWIVFQYFCSYCQFFFRYIWGLSNQSECTKCYIHIFGKVSYGGTILFSLSYSIDQTFIFILNIVRLYENKQPEPENYLLTNTC